MIGCGVVGQIFGPPRYSWRSGLDQSSLFRLSSLFNIPLPQIPTQAGFILTWPAFNSGMGICSYRRSCFPWNRTAFILPFAIFETASQTTSDSELNDNERFGVAQSSSSKFQSQHQRRCGGKAPVLTASTSRHPVIHAAHQHVSWFVRTPTIRSVRRGPSRVFEPFILRKSRVSRCGNPAADHPASGTGRGFDRGVCTEGVRIPCSAA